jgi:hypothetical protein
MMEKIRMVHVLLSMQTRPLSNIFDKSSEKQVGSSSSISEYKMEVVLLGPNFFLLDF